MIPQITLQILKISRAARILRNSSTIALCASFFVTERVLAQSAFTPQILRNNVPIPLSGQPFALDVDGDGLDEAGLTDGRSIVYVRNLGGGTFSNVPAGIDYPDSEGYFEFALAADIDGDGDEDITVIERVDSGSLQNTRCWILENGGDSTFSAVQAMPGFLRGATHYRWHDLDSDGRLDMLCIDADQQLRTFRNNGSNLFEPLQALPGETDVYLVFDINNDERDDDAPDHLDIVTFDVLPPAIRDNDDDDSELEEFRRFESRPTVYLNDGNGQFAEGRVAAPFTALTMNNQVHDIEGQGQFAPQQHYIAYVGGEVFSRVFWKGFLVRMSQQQLVDAFNATQFDNMSFTSGDFDGDGDMDVLTPRDRHSSTLPTGLLHLNDGQDTFVAADFPIHVAKATIGEFDGRPGDDLLVTESFNFNATLVSALRWIDFADGSPVPRKIPLDSAAGHWLVDVDADGDADLVSGSRNQEGIYEFRFANTDGARVEEPMTPFDEMPKVRNFAWRLKDIDRDGMDDLVSEHEWPPVILRNTGQPGFERQPIEIPTGGFYISASIYDDFDGDGDIDLAGTFSGFDDVSSWLNDGMFRFEVGEVGVRSDNLIFNGMMAAGDFDGDGDNDIAVDVYQNVSTRDFVWYENDAGAFPRKHVIASGVHGYQTTISTDDLDGDGDADLTVTRTVNPGRTGGLATFRNDGSGLFTLWQDWRSKSTARSNHRVLDIDLDGIPEIVEYSASPEPSGSARLRLLRQVGSGYEESEAWPLKTMDSTIRTGDVDGDGLIDLAVNNGNALLWFRNATGDPGEPLSVTIEYGDDSARIVWSNVEPGEFVVETSPNLKTWDAAEAVSSTHSGTIEFTALPPKGQQHAYYRLRRAE